MNLNVYLEDSLSKSLNICAKKMNKSKNAIIREALKEWIMHHQNQQWGNSILNFQGVKDAIPFESFRDDLISPDEDIFK